MPTTTNKSIRVVTIGDPGPIQQQISAALNSQNEFQLVEVLNSAERLARDIGLAKPEIILIEPTLGEQPTVDIIDDLALQFPEAGIVAILPEEDSTLIQQVMLAGARAFLIQPFTQINLLSTLRRVNVLESRRKASYPQGAGQGDKATRPLRNLTVFSPRGGVGCTTVAINLAMLFKEQTSKQVLLMDGKQFFGHMDVMLNIRSQNTVADLIPHANSLDERLVQDVVTPHASGIHVLLGPSSLQVAQGIRPDDLYTVFVSLQRMYDYIVVDGGNTLTENTVTLMDATDRILLLATPDLASLHDISRFIQISRSLAYSPDKLLVCLNREGLKGGVKAGDIETALQSKLFARIPDDSANALRSVNRGVPMVLRYVRSPVSRALKQLSTSLLQMKMADTTGMPGSSAVSIHQREALLASSQLG
jgi:pilus assembly protein CpaE